MLIHKSNNDDWYL